MFLNSAVFFLFGPSETTQVLQKHPIKKKILFFFIRPLQKKNSRIDCYKKYFFGQYCSHFHCSSVFHFSCSFSSTEQNCKHLKLHSFYCETLHTYNRRWSSSPSSSTITTPPLSQWLYDNDVGKADYVVLLDIRRVEDLKSCVRNAQEGHTEQSDVA